MAVPPSAADPHGVHHASVADEASPDRSDVRRPENEPDLRLYQSAGGGAARSILEAAVAATAEALERYAAATANLVLATATEIEPDRVIELDSWTLHSAEQQSDPAFPDPSAYPPDPYYTPAYDIVDNSRCWVPAGLMALRRDYGSLATSSGLAADFAAYKALLRAIQELVERDAYMITWLHGLAPRSVAIPNLQAEVDSLGGRIVAYDITPQFSPHPVACVAGTIPLRGRNRNSIGLACRATWAEAVEKAFLEFVQGTVYVGHQLAQAPQLEQLNTETCTGFDEHAVYWTVHDDEWWGLPLHANADKEPTVGVSQEAPGSTAHTWSDQLTELFDRLNGADIRLFYRMLPTAGLDQLGLRVFRALSPDLVPIHHNHNWPNLGGTAPDVRLRYPSAKPLTRFPSPYPHALG